MATLPRNNRLEVYIAPPGGDTGLQILGHFGPKIKIGNFGPHFLGPQTSNQNSVR